MMGVLALFLRWTFGTGANQPGPRIPDPDDPTGDGLLEEVSRVSTEPAAQVLRLRLAEAGIRATIAPRTPDAFRLLVFPTDLVDALVVLSRDSLEYPSDPVILRVAPDHRRTRCCSVRRYPTGKTPVSGPVRPPPGRSARRDHAGCR